MNTTAVNSEALPAKTPSAAVPRTRARRMGPVAAAVLAVAAGQFAMGFFTLLDQWLNPTEWVPIPGVTPIDQLQGGTKMILMWSNYAIMTGLFVQTLLAWLVTWAIAYEVLGRRRHVGKRLWATAACLFVAGIVCTFPPFYTWLIPG